MIREKAGPKYEVVYDFEISEESILEEERLKKLGKYIEMALSKYSRLYIDIDRGYGGEGVVSEDVIHNIDQLVRWGEQQEGDRE